MHREREPRRLRVLLVGNYPEDRQESMLRFAALLHARLPARSVAVELLQPRVVFARAGLPAGTRHWLGYLDKLLLFPRTLRARVRELRRAGTGDFLVHICDHSNAVYTHALQNVPHLVTCHDLLAVRSALGEFPENPTRWSGRQLQRLILQGLRRARRVTGDSAATLADVLRLSGLSPAQVSVTPVGLNYPYRPMPEDEASPILLRSLGRTAEARQPFILHVGGTQWYKNRPGVLRIFAQLAKRMPGPLNLVLAGKPLTPDLIEFITAEKLTQRVLSVAGCGNEELCALYSRAECLLFPSLAEGFGWPIIEAQACGCRVLTTHAAPMDEVAGPAAAWLERAWLAGDGSSAECERRVGRSAEALQQLLEEPTETRRRRIECGFFNAAKYSTDRMLDAYVELYQRIVREDQIT